MSGPAATAPGGTILVTDTTMNDGAGAAAPSVTRFYLSANRTVEAADVALQSRNVPSLAAAAVHTATTAVTIPVSTATGSYYLLAMADADASVAEASDANNVRSTSLRVGPDLTVASVTAPAQAAPGTTLVVSDTTS